MVTITTMPGWEKRQIIEKTTLLKHIDLGRFAFSLVNAFAARSEP
jgi:hypothetical protein